MGPFPMFYSLLLVPLPQMGQEAVHVFCGGGVKPSHDVQEPLSEVHCVFLAGGGGRCPGTGSRTPGRWRETSAWRHPREKAHHTARRPLVKAAGQADHHATRLQGDPAVLAPRAGGRRRGRRNLQKLQRGGRRGKAGRRQRRSIRMLAPGASQCSPSVNPQRPRSARRPRHKANVDSLCMK